MVSAGPAIEFSDSAEKNYDCKYTEEWTMMKSYREFLLISATARRVRLPFETDSSEMIISDSYFSKATSVGLLARNCQYVPTLIDFFK